MHKVEGSNMMLTLSICTHAAHTLEQTHAAHTLPCYMLWKDNKGVAVLLETDLALSKHGTNSVSITPIALFVISREYEDFGLYEIFLCF